MTKLYHYAETLQILSQLVLDKGLDYVDQNAINGSCEYIPTNFVNEDRTVTVRPPCLVGAFWARAGATPLQLREANKSGQIESVRAAGTMPIQVTRAAFELLRQAQSRQDNGKTWAEAVLRAGANADLNEDDDTISYS